ncbi:hypothetical protein HY490_00575 [Candidatus Woesearchaeota archaeon]|nr:hypothetical protein [Candidatus Woesearchaeota archaeon]
MGDAPKRALAFRLWIKDIVEGTFKKADSPYSPSEFTLQDGQSVPRVQLCGIVVHNAADTNDSHLTMDDSTGVLTIRAFDMPSHVHTIMTGTPVLVIGRPRQVATITYIMAEIIKPLHDIKWLDVWKKSLPREATHPADAILALIRSNDHESGADVEHLTRTIPNSDNIIADLLLKGRIFEVSPGRVKVLE